MERRTTQSVGHEIQSITAVSNYCILGPTAYTSKGNWWTDTSLPATDKLHGDKEAHNCHWLEGEGDTGKDFTIYQASLLGSTLVSGSEFRALLIRIHHQPYKCSLLFRQACTAAEHGSVWMKRCLSNFDPGQRIDWRAGRKKKSLKKKKTLVEETL